MTSAEIIATNAALAASTTADLLAAAMPLSEKLTETVVAMMRHIAAPNPVALLASIEGLAEVAADLHHSLNTVMANAAASAISALAVAKEAAPDGTTIIPNPIAVASAEAAL